MAVEIGRAVRPPDGSSFPELALGLIDDCPSGTLRHIIAHATRNRYRPASSHQLRDEFRTAFLQEIRVGKAPQAPSDDEITAVWRMRMRPARALIVARVGQQLEAVTSSVGREFLERLSYLRRLIIRHVDQYDDASLERCIVSH